MASIPVAPRLLRNYLFSVAADNFEAATESVLFAPSSSPVNWTGGNGVTHSDAPPETWLCTVGYMQDWDTVGSLGEYLLTHKGEQVTVTFSPNVAEGGTGPTFTAEVTLMSGGIGGSNGAYPTTSAAMPSSEPVLSRPVAP